MEKRKSAAWILAAVSLLLAALVFAGALRIERPRVEEFSREVSETAAIGSCADADVSFSIRGLFVQNGFRFQGDGAEKRSRLNLNRFLDDSATQVFYKLCASSALISLAVALLASYLLKSIVRKRMILPVVAPLLFALHFWLTVSSWRAGGYSVPMPGASLALGALAAFLALFSAAVFAELVFSLFSRRRFVAWILLLVLLVAGYFAGSIAKIRIWTPESSPSFGYVAEENAHFGEEEYLDEIVWNEDGTMTFEGKTYEPEMIPNPDHAGGTRAIVDYALELLNPAAGIYVNIVLPSFLETFAVPAAVYCVHALLWFALGLTLIRQRRERLEMEERGVRAWNGDAGLTGADARGAGDEAAEEAAAAAPAETPAETPADPEGEGFVDAIAETLDAAAAGPDDGDGRDPAQE